MFLNCNSLQFSTLLVVCFYGKRPSELALIHGVVVSIQDVRCGMTELKFWLSTGKDECPGADCNATTKRSGRIGDYTQKCSSVILMLFYTPLCLSYIFLHAHVVLWYSPAVVNFPVHGTAFSHNHARRCHISLLGIEPRPSPLDPVTAV